MFAEVYPSSVTSVFVFNYSSFVFNFCFCICFFGQWSYLSKVVALRAPAIALLEAAKLCHKRLFLACPDKLKKAVYGTILGLISTLILCFFYFL